MCLIDEVERVDPTRIVCVSRQHLSLDNPLRRNGRLSAVHAIEFAAQARPPCTERFACRLNARRGRGMLVSVRGCRLHVGTLDEAVGALRIEARRSAGGEVACKLRIRRVVAGRPRCRRPPRSSRHRGAREARARHGRQRSHRRRHLRASSARTGITSSSTLIAASRKPRAIAQRIVASGGSAEAVAFDVVDRDGVSRAMEHCIGRAHRDPRQQRGHARRRAVCRHEACAMAGVIDVTLEGILQRHATAA